MASVCSCGKRRFECVARHVTINSGEGDRVNEDNDVVCMRIRSAEHACTICWQFCTAIWQRLHATANVPADRSYLSWCAKFVICFTLADRAPSVVKAFGQRTKSHQRRNEVSGKWNGIQIRIAFNCSVAKHCARHSVADLPPLDRRLRCEQRYSGWCVMRGSTKWNGATALRRLHIATATRSASANREGALGFGHARSL